MYELFTFACCFFLKITKRIVNGTVNEQESLNSLQIGVQERRADPPAVWVCVGSLELYQQFALAIENRF